MPDETEPISDDAAIQSEEDEDLKRFRFRVSKNLTRRIDQYLTDRVSYLSRAAVQRLIDEGLVTVNAKVVKASYHPRAGDQVVMVAGPEPVNEILPEAIPLDVLYEDEHFMAINKPAGLIVHPARGRWTGTLVNALVYYGNKWSSVNGAWRPGILHRLDRNTTGIMLIAKTDDAHWRIARQFETRTIQKTYLAVVDGLPSLQGDVLDMPIGKDRYVREKQAVRKVVNGGKPAVTQYEVMETFTTPAPGHALLKLTPHTGRTHQLRVHLSTICLPITGDTIYGGRVFEAGDFRMERQALHAWRIAFVHPGTLKPIELEAPLPADMVRLLAILRGDDSPRRHGDTEKNAENRQ